jgi:hypothetical protein
VEQILRFYLGFSSWRTLREMGWGWPRSADWLSEQTATALLLPAGAPGP